jgi:hypothetical protein
VSTILGLRAFTHIRWDPRILIVDAREKRFPTAVPLDNPFFAWVRIGTRDEAQRLADDISGRHLIIVHEDEERALDLDHIFKGLELHSSALEAGERGWRAAVVEENTEMFGDVLVVTLNQLALNKRHYIFARDGCAVAVQPSGAISALREEVRHHGAKLQAILDIKGGGQETRSLAKLLGVPYVEAPFEICGMSFRSIGCNLLELQAEKCVSYFGLDTE